MVKAQGGERPEGGGFFCGRSRDVGGFRHGFGDDLF